MKSIFVNGNGVRLHAMVDGPEKGPLVVLLHGFPDFWYGWRFQIPHLAAAGYRVLAIDQRGYNLSDKPAGAMSYRLNLIVGDIAKVIEDHGGRASVIGHDWGGATTWALALKRPDLVERFVALNCPHPMAMAKRLLGDPSQTIRSWYVFFFQLPWLPEIAVRRHEFKLFTAGMREAGERGFTETDRQKYLAAWRQPGALTAAINWYRAMKLGGPPKKNREAKKFPPGLLIWGTEDHYLKAEMADDSLRLYPGLRLEKLVGISHWPAQQAPEQVNKLLDAFLREKS